MPDVRDALRAAAPRSTSDLDVSGVAARARRRRRRRVRTRLVAIVAVVGLVTLGVMANRDGEEDGSVVITRPDGAVHRVWNIPGAVQITVAGGDVWVLLQAGASSVVGRFDEAAGEVVDRRSLEGTALRLVGSRNFLWVAGEERSEEVQAALDRGRRDLPTTGRTGIVHRIEIDGERRTWRLGPTVPIQLVADGDRAWAHAVDAAIFRVSSLVYLEGPKDGEVAPLGDVRADYGFVLDGDRLWLDGAEALVAINRETGQVVQRRPAARLRGRTDDGRVWVDVGTMRPFRVRALDDAVELHATGDVVSIAGGIAVGAAWFARPDEDPDPDAVLEDLRDSNVFSGPLRTSTDTAFYLEPQVSVAGPAARLHRWLPEQGVKHPKQRLPLVEEHANLDLGECKPFVAGFVTDDAGEWSESVTEDTGIRGAVRFNGPGDAYIQALPGPAPWIVDRPGTERPAPEGFTKLYLARIADGFAAHVVVSDSPRQPPCNTATLIGHGVSADELLSQLGLAATLQYDDRTPP